MDKKEKQRLYYSEVRKKLHKEKHKAHRALFKAVKSGLILKPNKCERCGSLKQLDGHHPDYSKPLDVKWLCRKCHHKEHGGFNINKETRSHWTMRGSTNPKAKLNEKQVKEIKLSLGILTNIELAKKYKISRTTISDIKTGKKWMHVVVHKVDL